MDQILKKIGDLFSTGYPGHPALEVVLNPAFNVVKIPSPFTCHRNIILNSYKTWTIVNGKCVPISDSTETYGTEEEECINALNSQNSSQTSVSGSTNGLVDHQVISDLP